MKTRNVVCFLLGAILVTAVIGSTSQRMAGRQARARTATIEEHRLASGAIALHEGPSADDSSFLARLRGSGLTVKDLVDGLGASDAGHRRAAGLAIAALRDHYIEGSGAVADKGFNGRLVAGRYNGMVVWSALDVLASLRLSDPRLLDVMAERASFSWVPRDVNTVPGYSDTYRASAVLTRASLCALPALARQIAGTPGPESAAMSAKYALILSVTYSVLGPMSSPWLKHEAAGATDSLRKQALYHAAGLLSDDARQRVPALLMGMLEQASRQTPLDEGFDPDDLNAIDIGQFKVQWALPESLTDLQLRTADGITEAGTKLASRRMELTIALIANGISQRLTLEAGDRNRAFKPYPTAAQEDAVRVLGYLRPTFGSAIWNIWLKVRGASMRGAVDEGRANAVAAEIRALEQIDVPATKLLLGRIQAEPSANQEAAAPYVLGRLAGRYSVDLMNSEIARLQKLVQSEHDASEKEQDLEHVRRLTAMLKSGRDRRWFEGDLYGVGDQHAYDLIFPQAEERAPSTQPPALPP